MDTFAAIEQHLTALRGLLGEVSGADAASRVSSLGDEDVVAVLRGTTGAIRELETLRVAAAGITADRSGKDAGHNGLSQRKGHRTPVSLVQEVTGATRGDAIKAVRLGQSLTSVVFKATDAAPPTPRWDRCLTEAFTRGAISLHQQTAIRGGLGEPPLGAESAWSEAASRLIAEASTRSVEDVGGAARTIRDLLDPDGAQRRFDERFERRSFRLWTDADGLRHGTFTFDDEGAAWVTAMIDSALRPRRGGPRFVDSDELDAAEALIADPRTNEQLTYDLMIDVLRAGTLADSAAVFGARQAGVRVVVSEDAMESAVGGHPAVAILDETGATVPAAVALRAACGAGSVECTVDRDGNPLFLGRGARMFTSTQKVALSIRDGGCRWPGCERPPSYCESHHIDPYSEGGATDVDRGIQLCRYHHMGVHHHGWRIIREGTGPFVLRSAVGDDVVLESRLERRYAWGDLRPPPTRFRPAV